MPRLVKLAEHLFRGKPSNAQQLLTVFLNESKDESIRDFVINRNPEFALKIVRPDNSTDKDQDNKVEAYLKRESQIFKTLNTVRFENLNRYFTPTKTFSSSAPVTRLSSLALATSTSSLT